MAPRRFAGVEGGGSSFVCAIAEGEPTNIVERAEFSSDDPAKTIASCADWLSKHEYDTLGVACFGPVDLHRESPTYGYITTTPKVAWRNTNVLGPLKAVRNVPTAFDTDVNAPAFAEYKFNSRPGQSSCAYITVGTGVGVGIVVNGKTVFGMLHPEGGHVPTLQRPGDTFRGVGDHPWSVEGQVCSEAISRRAGVAARDLKAVPDSSPVWDDVAFVLGSLCMNLVLTCSPERIVISGGIMQRQKLFPLVRKYMQEMLNGYIQMPQLLKEGPDGIDGFIVPSVWGNSAGIVGAITIGAEAALNSSQDGFLKRLLWCK